MATVIVQEECTSRTAWLAAPVLVPALPGLAMADRIRTMTMRTVGGLHGAMQA
jgi:hypothetical protein